MMLRLAMLIGLCAALTCGGVPALGAADGPTVTRATFSVEGAVTRFALELTREPTRRVFAVNGPPRLVVDLDRTAFAIDAPPSPSGLVAAWRFGDLSASTARIVLDLAQPALLSRSYFLPPLAGRPGRLVFELQAVEANAFATVVRSGGASLAAAEAAAASRAGPVVVIDPGHGGVDPGAVKETPSGTLREKDITLAFARRLQADLQTAGLTVRLTRGDDRFVSLNRRIRIARAYGADLFVSIHADAAPQDYVFGSTVYTLSERPSDAQAAALAARENLADAVSGVIEPERQEQVSGILADLLRRETKALSYAFAEDLVADLSREVRTNNNPHRSARFRVLMAHDIPSVLLELGFMTNDVDVTALTDAEWQERASRAVTRSVLTFFGRQPDTDVLRVGSAASVQQ